MIGNRKQAFLKLYIDFDFLAILHIVAPLDCDTADNTNKTNMMKIYTI